jgi:hypothetical protein
LRMNPSGTTASASLSWSFSVSGPTAPMPGHGRGMGELRRLAGLQARLMEGGD